MYIYRCIYVYMYIYMYIYIYIHIYIIYIQILGMVMHTSCHHPVSDEFSSSLSPSRNHAFDGCARREELSQHIYCNIGNNVKLGYEYEHEHEYEHEYEYEYMYIYIHNYVYIFAYIIWRFPKIRVPLNYSC